MLNIEAFIAANRFGFGISPKEYKAIRNNPRAWVYDQLEDKNIDIKYLKNLKSSKELNNHIIATKKSKDKEKIKALRKYSKEIYNTEIKQRTLQAVNSNTPFLERLTHFWSNHFAVSIKRKEVVHLVGAYEREAIRPNILGNFSDLMLAAESHPAMLYYLDNAASIGPNSKAGINRKKGLNENLAREILELHSLGVSGGYKQEDVISLAKLITGWTVARRGTKSGSFYFEKNMHEPGPIRFLDKKYNDTGLTRGKIAIKDIAKHPSTAKFVTKKLVTHFAGEDAPKRMFRKVEQTFLNSRGDLTEIYKTLLSFDEIWSNKYQKIKSNSDLVISIAKLIEDNKIIENKTFLTSYKFLGRMPFNAAAPTGYTDLNQELVSPDIMSRRIELAALIAKRISFKYSPSELLNIALGEVASDRTTEAIGNAPSNRLAYSLLLASPEFQRR